MGLLGEVQAAKEKTCRGCRVAEVKALLGDEGGDLETVIRDESVSDTVVHAVLKGRGISLGHKSISRHRRGECGCPQ